MIHKDKQDKWFSNDTSHTESVWLGDEPITLADWQRWMDEHVEPLMKTESVLSEAERIVNGDRQADYSDPVENFKHIASIASAISKEDLSPTTCAIVMIAVKLARENYKHKRDNLVDLAGYVEILHRIKENEVEV
jgi:hypothetical protein